MNGTLPICIDSSEVVYVHKKKYIGIAAACGMVFLIVNVNTAQESAKLGVALCLETVIPSIFPFLVLSCIMVSFLSDTSSVFLAIIAKQFGISDGLESILIPIFLGGYPIGAKTVASLHTQGILKKKDAERYLSFANQAGPAFLFGMLPHAFSSVKMVFAIWAIQICSAWIVSGLFHQEVSLCKESYAKQKTPAILEDSINAMAKISGWIVLFRIGISYLDQLCLKNADPNLRITLLGIVELSNGCLALNNIGNEMLRFIVCNGLLSFGGICVIFQTISVCRDLHIYYYVVGKLLQTGVAVILSWFGWNYPWILPGILLGIGYLVKRSRNFRVIGV